MKITIIKADNFVSIDGVQTVMDLSFLPEDFHALQFNLNKGHVESTNIDNCLKIDSLTDWPSWEEFNSQLELAQNNTDLEILNDAQMLDLIRLERTNRLFTSDIEIIKLIESEQPIPQNLKTFRQELRDLPNKIESGELPKPVWNAESQEVEFNQWPIAP